MNILRSPVSWDEDDLPDIGILTCLTRSRNQISDKNIIMYLMVEHHSFQTVPVKCLKGDGHGKDKTKINA